MGSGSSKPQDPFQIQGQQARRSRRQLLRQQPKPHQPKSAAAMHAAIAQHQHQNLAPKPAFREYPGRRMHSYQKEHCVALGNPLIADRDPERLQLLMLYDARYCWRDLDLDQYRTKLRNVFKGDADVLRWIHSDDCRFRLDRGRAYVDRTSKKGKGHVIPFLGDPMYGRYADAIQVTRNLVPLWKKMKIMPEVIRLEGGY